MLLLLLARMEGGGPASLRAGVFARAYFSARGSVLSEKMGRRRRGEGVACRRILRRTEPMG